MRASRARSGKPPGLIVAIADVADHAAQVERIAARGDGVAALAAGELHRNGIAGMQRQLRDVGGLQIVGLVEFRRSGEAEAVAGEHEILDGIAVVRRLHVEGQRRRNADALGPTDAGQDDAGSTKVEIVVLALAVGRVGNERAERAREHLVEADAEALARLLVEQQANVAVAGPASGGGGADRERHRDVRANAVDPRLAVDGDLIGRNRQRHVGFAHRAPLDGLFARNIFGVDHHLPVDVGIGEAVAERQPDGDVGGALAAEIAGRKLAGGKGMDRIGVGDLADGRGASGQLQLDQAVGRALRRVGDGEGAVVDRHDA